MSLSLSSLLNPSPDGEGKTTDAQNPSMPSEPQNTNETHTGAVQPSHAHVNDGEEHRRQSMSNEQPSGNNGYGNAVQLPPPTSTGRKMSSPTLEQYQVASRSPEQRRASIVSPVPSNITLPPLQGLASSSLADKQMPSNEPPFTSNMSAPFDENVQSPAYIKQENAPTPQGLSPSDGQRSIVHQHESEFHAPNKVTALKMGSGLRHSSPLRESSVPMPSTEVHDTPSVSKKGTAQPKPKKGTATTTKKTQPSKKRKLEQSGTSTPSSRAAKVPALKVSSSRATPVQSSPAPSTRSQSAEADDEPYDDEDDEEDEDGDGDGGVYCICRKPDTGTFMIGCDGTCDDWFHGKCVNIDERDKNLMDKYICPNCAKAGIGRTTWKRVCRRSGCRQPARIGNSKSGKQNSKYCSEECGVTFFKDVVGRSRGREDMGRHRSSRRKGGAADQSQRIHDDDDLGPRGGLLAAGEAKALIDSAKSADDFRRLGEGVLSPPSTPDSKRSSAQKEQKGLEKFTDAERDNLNRITQDKDIARQKHRLLKDRMTFITMAKQAASRVATEKELKPKDYCGYDSRVQWTEEQFSRWRSSSEGKRALETETLAPDADDSSKHTSDKTAATTTNGLTVDIDQDLADYEICDRKKCARHLEWPKLAVDDVRFEIADNSDRMRALETEERDLRQRAALRAKKQSGGSAGRDGTVEVHFQAPATTTLTPPAAATDAAAVVVDSAPDGTNKGLVSNTPGEEGLEMDIEQTSNDTAAIAPQVEEDVVMAD